MQKTLFTTLLLSLTLIALYPLNLQAQNIEAQANQLIQQATTPVDSTTYDDEFGSHFTDLDFIKSQIQTFAKADPSVRRVLDNWTKYKDLAKLAHKFRANITVDVIQNFYGSSKTPDEFRVVSQALVNAILDKGAYRTVGLRGFAVDTVRAVKLGGFSQDELTNQLQSSRDSSAFTETLLQSEGTLAYEFNSRLPVWVVGAEKPLVLKLYEKVVRNKLNLSATEMRKLIIAVSRLQSEIALARTIIAANLAGDPNPALVVAAEHGDYLKDIAEIRGFDTRFFGQLHAKGLLLNSSAWSKDSPRLTSGSLSRERLPFALINLIRRIKFRRLLVFRQPLMES
jgi:hypothetical protein